MDAFTESYRIINFCEGYILLAFAFLKVPIKGSFEIFLSVNLDPLIVSSDK